MDSQSHCATFGDANPRRDGSSHSYGHPGRGGNRYPWAHDDTASPFSYARSIADGVSDAYGWSFARRNPQLDVGTFSYGFS